MNNPCKDPSLLSALLDGELSPEASHEVEAHLAQCPDCRRQMQALEKADELVKGMPTLEPSADFNRTFWAKVEKLEARPAPFEWFRYLVTGWRPLAAGSLAGLAAAVIIAYGPNKALTPEELFIAENIEMLEEFEVIRHLDMLESWEALDAMEERS